jgi:hypothetical protein
MSMGKLSKFHENFVARKCQHIFHCEQTEVQSESPILDTQTHCCANPWNRTQDCSSTTWAARRSRVGCSQDMCLTLCNSDIHALHVIVSKILSIVHRSYPSYKHAAVPHRLYCVIHVYTVRNAYVQYTHTSEWRKMRRNCTTYIVQVWRSMHRHRCLNRSEDYVIEYT